MNRTNHLTLLLGLIAISTLSPQPSTFAQGTAFTYQGRLTDGTGAANGLYDLRFSIWSASAGGRVIAGPLTNAATAVSNGLFAVTLDFGSGVFGGDDCWLGMGVRSNGTGSFTTLSSRIQVTATPYAIMSSGVGAGDITSSMLSSGAVTSDKIAAGAVKGYQIDDGGGASYQSFQSAVQGVSSNSALPFTSLALISSTNGITPAFSLTVGGASLGTVIGFAGAEGMSQPYWYVVEVQSSGGAINTESKLGQTAILTFTRNSRTTTFNGIVTACTLAGAGSSGLLYTVRIEPLLAYLGFNTDYRIYQGMKAPEVASAAYQGGTTNTLLSSLQGSYFTHDYVGQYAETSLNFFNRILEFAGAFYFFNHSVSPAALTLGDSPSSYLSAPNSPFIYYGDTATNVPTGADYIRAFQQATHQSVLNHTLDSYNFTIPTVDLSAKAPSPAGVGERYEFDGMGSSKAENDVLVKLRADRQKVERATIAGAGTAPDLRPGYTFTLTDQTGAGLGGAYLVTDVRHAGFVRVTNGVSTLFYGNQFTVIPASLSYRPALRTPKPQALPCTAAVTGPAGQEVYTDEYGRIKVQFHWDRYGTNDHHSSAWLRMTTPIASGSGRGILFLPRVGDEVLVSFIQGDPDQPVVTGSLYNATHTPPWTLPDNKNVSTIRSTGTPGQSSQVNEIMFDDTAGAQLFKLQGAYDMNLTAAHDLDLAATRDLTLAATRDFILRADHNVDFTSSGKLTMDVAGDFILRASAISLGGVVRADTLQASAIQASGNFYMNDKDIHWRGDDYHGAGWYGAGKPFGTLSPDGPVLYGYSGGALGSIHGTATNVALVWNYSGYVGIGTTSPGHLLQVGNAYSDGNAWTPSSDRDLKGGFEPVDPAAILEKVTALPITRWHYTNDPTTPHLGPVAQDFHAAFGLGADDRHITDVDEGGVALAAIKGLNQKLTEELKRRDTENAEIKARLERLEQLLNAGKGGS